MVALLSPPEQTTHPTLNDCASAMRSPAFELDSEEAALLLLAVNEAALGGYNFTALELAFIDIIRRQLAARCEDFEQGVDEGLEDDRCDDEDSEEAGSTGLTYPRTAKGVKHGK